MGEDIFCKIVKKDIPSNIVLEEEEWIAINDVQPKAPVHVLIIPKRHMSSVLGLNDDDASLAGSLFLAIRKVAQKTGISDKGFRVIINHGEHGGQEVPHLHIHVMGGKKL